MTWLQGVVVKINQCLAPVLFSNRC